jgi:hypothetical protein
LLPQVLLRGQDECAFRKLVGESLQPEVRRIAAPDEGFILEFGSHPILDDVGASTGRRSVSFDECRLKNLVIASVESSIDACQTRAIEHKQLVDQHIANLR